MRTPREAATSRAQGVTMAPGGAEISPPGGTAWTSWAVTTVFKRGMITKGRSGERSGIHSRGASGGQGGATQHPPARSELNAQSHLNLPRIARGVVQQELSLPRRGRVLVREREEVRVGRRPEAAVQGQGGRAVVGDGGAGQTDSGSCWRRRSPRAGRPGRSR